MPVSNSPNDVMYELPPDQAVIITEYFMRVWEKLGKPSDPLSRTGMAMVDSVILAYEKTFPEEWHQWLENRKEYQDNELTLHEQINTGRSLASYPLFIYNALKRLFPNTDFSNREFVLKFIKLYPAFRFANKA